MTKSELMSDFDGWVTDPSVTRDRLTAFVADPGRVGTPFLGRYFVCTSSGTTGHPGLFVHDARAVTVYRALSLARIDRHWLPPSTWQHLLRHRMRWVAVVGTGGHFAGAGWMEAERRRSRWRHRAYSVVSVQQPIQQVAAAVAAANPAILTGYSSALDQLATLQRDGALHLDPVFVESTGETLTPETSRRLTEAFNCPVRNAFAASEFLLLGFSCDRGWVHVNADWAVLEPIDAAGRPSRPGDPSSTVLLTSLANRVQPLIRYDLGDSVVVGPNPCSCGSRLPAVRVAGRSDDVLHLADDNGTRIDVLPLAIGSITDRTPGVARCQIVQTGPATLRIRLEVSAGWTPDAVWAELFGQVHTLLSTNGLPHVALVRADEPPQQCSSGGKLRRVIARD